MATLTRRLQVLMQEERFAHLERIAREQGTTVAALVRDAVDRTYPPEGRSAADAADRLLARAPIELGTWEDAKAEVEDALGRGSRA
ncbi:hypothetical protein ER308_08675 [Egibacter rhizosphaerae]|uniref:Antitoxin n=1 Tax=Egibacter rhizosphaerae TaxID=1670831 RepID=A0A411YEJ3_9ACTN|nr:hypothetical protein [Egibacter rhizosphaerae]QBI19616.1 hypothetical protein ER308_08675 [Egibacter rhizosphaerae]